MARANSLCSCGTPRACVAGLDQHGQALCKAKDHGQHIVRAADVPLFFADQDRILKEYADHPELIKPKRGRGSSSASARRALLRANHSRVQAGHHRDVDHDSLAQPHSPMYARHVTCHGVHSANHVMMQSKSDVLRACRRALIEAGDEAHNLGTQDAEEPTLDNVFARQFPWAAVDLDARDAAGDYFRSGIGRLWEALLIRYNVMANYTSGHVPSATSALCVPLLSVAMPVTLRRFHFSVRGRAGVSTSAVAGGARLQQAGSRRLAELSCACACAQDAWLLLSVCYARWGRCSGAKSILDGCGMAAHHASGRHTSWRARARRRVSLCRCSGRSRAYGRGSLELHGS